MIDNFIELPGAIISKMQILVARSVAARDFSEYHIFQFL